MTGTLEEMASQLQRKFEALVADDKDIYEKACKGTYLCRHLFYFPAFFLQLSLVGRSSGKIVFET